MLQWQTVSLRQSSVARDEFTLSRGPICGREIFIPEKGVKTPRINLLPKFKSIVADRIASQEFAHQSASATEGIVCSVGRSESYNDRAPSKPLKLNT